MESFHFHPMLMYQVKCSKISCGSISHKPFSCFPLYFLDVQFSSVQFSSVAQSCPTLCDPMNCSTPVFPVLHYFPEFTQTHVNPTISFYVVPFSSCLQCFPSTGSFPMLRLFPSDGPSIEASGSASVLPMSIQG